MSKADFIERIRASRQALNGAISGLSEEQIARAIVAGDWALRDILAHLAAWQGEALIWVERAARGEETGPGLRENPDEWNARRVAERRRLALVDVIQEFNDTHDRLLAALEQWPEDRALLGPDGWDASARLWWLTEHDAEHLPAISAYRQKLGQQAP